MAILLTILLLLASGAWAIAAESFDLSWMTFDGGGGTSSGGGYTLGGTVGQPDAGLLAGGEYTLGGGFWGGGALFRAAYEVYLPLVVRSVP
jgi:hypothetical protein